MREYMWRNAPPRRVTIAKLAAICALPLISVPSGAQESRPFAIAQLSDFSGPIADLSGQGTTAAMRLAIEDFGGRVLGRSIDLRTADHLNKTDVGLSAARKFYDEGVNAVFDVGFTSVALGVQELARDKNKIAIYLSSASADLTGAKCSPNGIHWTYNNYSQALGVTNYLLKNRGDSWFFLTVDYAYGTNVQRDTTAIIEKGGGKIIGSARHAFETTDFSSDLLKAQASGAQVIALATTTAHSANIIKQADEFGLRPRQILAPLSLYYNDVRAAGLKAAQGLLATEAYYWDQNDETRAFGKRYMERVGKMPNMIQASAYGAVLHYLNAVQAVGSEDTAAILAKMKQTPVNDFMTKNGSIRPDGRVMRQMYVFQVKKPEESTSQWDVYKQVQEIPADQAFAPADPKICPPQG